jgi:hypothetical protein
VVFGFFAEFSNSAKRKLFWHLPNGNNDRENSKYGNIEILGELKLYITSYETHKEIKTPR